MYSTSKVADVHVDTTANRIQISIVTSDVVDLERIFIPGHSLHTLMMYANALGGESRGRTPQPSAGALDSANIGNGGDVTTRVSRLKTSWHDPRKLIHRL